MKLALLLMLAMLIASCGDTYEMQSESMAPTIKPGDVVDADMHAYEDTTPARWDMVVYNSPNNDGEDWVHRVVGLPSDVLDITDSGLFINGKRERYAEQTLKIRHTAGYNDNSKIIFPYTVPHGHYLLLGDNPAEAIDGRYIGPTPLNKIKGKILGVNPLATKIVKENK